MALHEEQVAVEMEELLTADEVLVPHNAWRTKSAFAVLCALGLVGAASTLSGSPMFVGLQNLVGKEERMDIVPSYPACSTFSENCMSTGCCQVSGHKCYMKSNGQAFCKKECTPGVKGFTCEQPPNAAASVPADGAPGTSLYCFSVYSKDTGSQKPSHELELFTKQKEFGVSIFGCEQWDVFSDVEVPIGDYNTLQVFDTRGEWHRLKRKVSGTWVNWGIFVSIWERIRNEGKGQNTLWTVKADADAVFIPQRLRQYITDRNLIDSSHGLYLENCRNVQYGYFGNLEVISKNGVAVLLKHLDECHQSFGTCADTGCDWKWGPWGEDVFVQRCMDHHYVDKVEAFDLTRDGACEADRPEGQKKNKKWRSPDCSAETAASIHPFKKVKPYFKCMGEIMQKQYDV